jgi:hypothetical protein
VAFKPKKQTEAQWSVGVGGSFSKKKKKRKKKEEERNRKPLWHPQ